MAVVYPKSILVGLVFGILVGGGIIYFSLQSDINGLNHEIYGLEESRQNLEETKIQLVDQIEEASETLEEQKKENLMEMKF